MSKPNTEHRPSQSNSTLRDNTRRTGLEEPGSAYKFGVAESSAMTLGSGGREAPTAGDENAGAPIVGSFDELEINAGASGHGDASLEAAGIIREGALRSRGLISPLREPAPLRAPNVAARKES